MPINDLLMTKSKFPAWSTNLFLASKQFLCEDIYHPKIQHDRSSHLQAYWPKNNASAWLVKLVAALASVLPGPAWVLLVMFHNYFFWPSIKNTQPQTNQSYPQGTILK